MSGNREDVPPHIGYVTLWTSEGFVAVREDDPRVTLPERILKLEVQVDTLRKSLGKLRREMRRWK